MTAIDPANTKEEDEVREGIMEVEPVTEGEEFCR